MCDFTTGDDFIDITGVNIDTSCISEIASLETEIIQQEVSPLQVDLKNKRGKRGKYKRKTVAKATWTCEFCKYTFCNKQSLQEHMENPKICLKKQKRLRDEEINLAPHEDIGASLQKCVEILRNHIRMDDPPSKVR